MNNFKEQINLENLPSHVAIIMDGNGRWAKKQGKLRLFGHNNGVSSVRAVTEASAELGLKYLTLYAFSTENWNRPQDEVNGLMKLLIQTIEAETPTLNKNNVRLLSIGDSSRMPEDVNKRLQACIKTTENNTGLTLILALSYSSRWEITKATQDIANDIAQGIIKKEEITEILEKKELKEEIARITKRMNKAASELNFEEAAVLRDELKELKIILRDYDE